MNGKYEKEFEEKEGFLNFTCAHEIGHWILHVDESNIEQVEFKIKTEEKEKLICRDTMKKEPIEIQADMFAANLLMPSQVIIKDIADLKEIKKITWLDLYELKDKYKVTISALVSRLQSLKLICIKENYL
ncbi:ImmA/IrrE family metallo-endopeptidase [uncultured Clostridium sp.]|uniref:ImmA/IrrE family metallo-endopeptidase n=1 Tax=uncultured Clostridium sp. TaxID=59620 RepID=UPI0026027EBB|nr:ImmA/IrrE family metallo-endopeptidase [uncultured Clostridium sp.]